MWLGYVSIRTELNSWVSPITEFYYMELSDFYTQRSPTSNKYPNLHYVDTHTLGIL